MEQLFQLPLKSEVFIESHLLKKSKSLISSTKMWTDSVHRKITIIQHVFITSYSLGSLPFCCLGRKEKKYLLHA